MSQARRTSTTARWRCAAPARSAETFLLVNPRQPRGTCGARHLDRLLGGIRLWFARMAGCGGARCSYPLFTVAFRLIGFAVPPRPVSCWTSLLYAFRALCLSRTMRSS